MPADAAWQRDASVQALRLLLSAGAGAILVGASRGRKLQGAALLLAGNALDAHARDFVRAAVKAQTAPFQEYARTALAGAYVRLVALGAPPAGLGVRVFLVRRRFRPPFREQLIQVAKVRLGSARAGTGINWTRGKGVIGRCWAEGKAVLLDSAAAYAPYANVSDRAWMSAPVSIRLNLSPREFRAIGPKYSAAAAMPILDQAGIVRGCVVADVLAGSPGAAILGDEALKVLADAAVVVGNTLATMPRWVYH